MGSHHTNILVDGGVKATPWQEYASFFSHRSQVFERWVAPFFTDDHQYCSPWTLVVCYFVIRQASGS